MKIVYPPLTQFVGVSRPNNGEIASFTTLIQERHSILTTLHVMDTLRKVLHQKDSRSGAIMPFLQFKNETFALIQSI